MAVKDRVDHGNGPVQFFFTPNRTQRELANQVQVAVEAFGRAPVDMGAGGTIPFVADFNQAFPKAALLLTGAGDPFSNAHSEDESVDLADVERSTVAEALFFEYLAGR